MLEQYNSFDVEDAVRRLEYQLDHEYVDISGYQDEIEVSILKEALKMFTEKYDSGKDIRDFLSKCGVSNNIQ